MGFINRLPKPALFALVGAVGSLLGALPGEVLLVMTYKAPPPPPPPPPPHAVCLLIDCSGSMNGAKLAEVKSAAIQFARNRDLSKDRVAVVGFGSNVHRVVELSDQLPALERGIGSLNDGGSTRMDWGLSEAVKAVEGAAIKRAVLLFTDGQPTGTNTVSADTQQVAHEARAKGIKVVAIGTDDADISFLTSLTGDRRLVFWATSGGFATAFGEAAKAIFTPGLIGSRGTFGAYGYREALARVAGWTAWLAIGMSIALLLAQTRSLGRRWPKPLSLTQVSLGALGAGFVAGSGGQVLFSAVASFPSIEWAGRVAGWTILGAILGRGMALFVPNLQARRSIQGGAIGGALAAMAFLFISAAMADAAGRFMGALVLGALIGLLVGLVEVIFREAWLTVAFSPKEVTRVTLGPTPVSIGSGPQSTIFVPGVATVEVEYSLKNGRLTCLDKSTGRMDTPAPGEWRMVGTVAVAVNTPDQKADLNSLGQAFQPPAPNAIRPSAQASEAPALNGLPGDKSRGLVLRLSGGKEIALVAGKTIFGSDLDGLESSAAQAVAAVQGHPTKTHVLGLLNLSSCSWQAQNTEGQELVITKGMTITIKDGLKIRFGTTSGEVRCGD